MSEDTLKDEKIDSKSADAWERARAAMEAEENGILFSFSPSDGVEWRFKIGSMSDWSKPYHRALGELRADPVVVAFYKRTSEPGYVATPEDDEFEDLLIKRSVARGVIRAWRVSGPDGKPLERNDENTLKLFEHFPELYRALITKANDPTAFGRADTSSDKDKEGNS